MTREHEKVAATTTIGAAKSDIYQKVFFLGPYARRVGFASQQNRALNLVWALTRTGEIPPGGEVAVVGAGLSGITTAIALADEGYSVTLIEQKNAALNRQRHSNHRFVHPTINEWPDRQQCEPTTTLPYFDWMGDFCAQIMDSLNKEWERLAGKHKEKLKPPVWNAKIIGLSEPDGDNTVRLDVADEKNERLELMPFSAVIVTSGFRDEPVEEYSFLRTYWKDDNLEDFLHDERMRFVVSGCGDGGLIDTMRLVHEKFRGGELIVDVLHLLQNTRWKHAALIAKAEKQASVNSAARDRYIKEGSSELRDVYVAAAKDLPPAVRELLDSSLRQIPNLVQLVCLEKVPYSPLAAPIHKLLLAHATVARRVKHVWATALSPYQEYAMEVVPSDDAADRAAFGKDADVSLRVIDGKELVVRRLHGKVVIRHGAKPNFETLLKDKTAFERLRDRQLDIAADLDKPLWSKGQFPLHIWPPHRKDGKFSSEDLGDRLRRAKPLHRTLVDIDATLSADDKSGFWIEHSEKSLADPVASQILKHLPKKLFGFPLQTRVIGTKAEGAEAQSAPAAGLQSSGTHVLQPGMPVASLRGKTAKMDGRLGPFVRDAGGGLFALTVSHLLPASRTGERVSIIGTGMTLLGTARAASAMPPPPYFDQSECLSLIEIAQSSRTTNAYGPYAIEQVADPAFIFGQKVYLALPGVPPRVAYVSSNATSVTFVNPSTKYPEVYAGVIRVRSVSREPFSEAGDSGAPVVLEDGSLVGLVLSGNNEDKHSKYTYVAPAAGYMKRHGLTLDKDVANNWANAAGSRPAGSGEHQPALDMAIALARMTRKFALEPDVFGPAEDPETLDGELL